MTQEKNKKYNLRVKSIFIILFVSLIVTSSIIGIVVMTKTNSILNVELAKAKEDKRPANLDIIVINDKACIDCFSLISLTESIKKENVKIKSEKMLDTNNEEAKKLISKYNIVKLPSLLISGEINKIASLKAYWPKIGQVVNNTFVLRQTGARYLDLTTNKVRGKISISLISDKSCTSCYSVQNHLSILSGLGLSISDSVILDKTSAKGRTLVNKYRIKLVPTIVITGDTEAYPNLKNIWSQVGTIEKDGAYIFRDGVKSMGTYKDLATNKVVSVETK